MVSKGTSIPNFKSASSENNQSLQSIDYQLMQEQLALLGAEKGGGLGGLLLEATGEGMRIYEPGGTVTEQSGAEDGSVGGAYQGFSESDPNNTTGRERSQGIGMSRRKRVLGSKSKLGGKAIKGMSGQFDMNRHAFESSSLLKSSSLYPSKVPNFE